LTAIIAPSADPISGEGEEEETIPSEPDEPEDQDEINLCSGRCYSVADTSPQGYSCNSNFLFLTLNSYVLACIDPNCALCTSKECLLCFDGFNESGENCIEDNFYGKFLIFLKI